jgi:hypothetical protein
METIIERYGCLTKVESIWCMEEFGIQGTCILESRQVFPGYYSQNTHQIKPKHIFIMSREKYSLEEITRITSCVRKHVTIPFDAAYCEVSIGNKLCGGVRITGIDNYNTVRALQSAYHDCGLQLKKKVKGIDHEDAVIKVRKFFRLQKINDNLFLDKSQAGIGYFILPELLIWGDFEKIIRKLKNNWNDNLFDAALCFIYENSRITDMVRIYSRDLNEDFLEKIRSAYFKYQ